VASFSGSVDFDRCDVDYGEGISTKRVGSMKMDMVNAVVLRVIFLPTECNECFHR
jgi:hypothetical protein